MDVLSHGLWGGAPFLYKSRKDHLPVKKSFWLAFAFGVLPDVSAFGWFFITLFLTRGLTPPDFTKYEPPRPDLVPQYVHTIYNYSHSIFIFALAFAVVWFILKRPLLEMMAWGLHILMDIPTHTHTFFPTPFLFPFSSYEFSGINWASMPFFAINWAVLIALYTYLLLKKRRV